jgi:hypothetical protein
MFIENKKLNKCHAKLENIFVKCVLFQCSTLFRSFYTPLQNSVCTNTEPITVVARCNPWTVFARWNWGIVGSNPTRGMVVCVHLFCVCVVLCVRMDLATDWSTVLPTVYRIKKPKWRPRSRRLYSHREKNKMKTDPLRGLSSQHSVSQ